MKKYTLRISERKNIYAPEKQNLSRKTSGFFLLNKSFSSRNKCVRVYTKKCSYGIIETFKNTFFLLLKSNLKADYPYI